MKSESTIKTAIKKINKNGVLLVFPKNNQKEPHSLWSELHPRTKMKWEWDADSDDKVASLWHLMKKLSGCREVVYSKWYQGRATFFSRELFTAMLAKMQRVEHFKANLSMHSRDILSTLEMDLPLSTREVKKINELQGKYLEPTYNRAMKDLFSRFLIVAFGEVDDGAFPSLAVGATAQLYEDLWLKAESMNEKTAQSIVDKWMPTGSHFRKFFDKTLVVIDSQGSQVKKK